MTEYTKPLPTPGIDSKPYWDAARRHELMMQKCQDCGRVYFPPSVSCNYCSSLNVEWVKLSGRGRLYTFAVANRGFTPVWAEEVPYPVIMVELEEGPRLISSIVDCKTEDLKLDMPVEVVFDDVTEEATLVKFRPASTR